MQPEHKVGHWAVGEEEQAHEHDQVAEELEDDVVHAPDEGAVKPRQHQDEHTRDGRLRHERLRAHRAADQAGREGDGGGHHDLEAHQRVRQPDRQLDVPAHLLDELRDDEHQLSRARAALGAVEEGRHARADALRLREVHLVGARADELACLLASHLGRRQVGVDCRECAPIDRRREPVDDVAHVVDNGSGVVSRVARDEAAEVEQRLFVGGGAKVRAEFGRVIREDGVHRVPVDEHAHGDDRDEEGRHKRQQPRRADEAEGEAVAVPPAQRHQRRHERDPRERGEDHVEDHVDLLRGQRGARERDLHNLALVLDEGHRALAAVGLGVRVEARVAPRALVRHVDGLLRLVLAVAQRGAVGRQVRRLLHHV
mmetsp:Transcript_1841/g.5999  ORF Transcript_1841/g.5999 Transcript_1841/m.5999 type:complete len:370 (-) Transcript_1841:444-1553(-)